jgi:hypothetical protein
MTDAPDPTHDDGGAVGRFLSRVFGRSYRTTLAGLVATVAQGVALAPGVDPAVQHWAQVVAGFASGAGLLIAKDSRVSGRPK